MYRVDVKTKRERRVGNIFIRELNKENKTSFILETESERLRRNDPPDLIFKEGGRVLTVEVVSVYDPADKEAEKSLSYYKRKGKFRRNKFNYMYRVDYYSIVKDLILSKIKKNIKCDILLVDCWRNRCVVPDYIIKRLKDDTEISVLYNKVFNRVYIINGKEELIFIKGE